MFDEFDELIRKKLIIEIMASHSNIIILDSNNVIIDSIHHVVTSREILPGKIYCIPENFKNSFLLLDNFQNFLRYSTI